MGCVTATGPKEVGAQHPHGAGGPAGQGCFLQGGDAVHTLLSVKKEEKGLSHYAILSFSL